MKKYFILFTLMFPVFLNAQSGDFNKITDAGSGVYFMYYDSSDSKSTIVEFEDFIALVEAPVKDEGGNAKVLIEHQEAGEKILNSLNNYFKNKPLKYFLHSHWHPHSVSTINPFLKSGVKVVSTEANQNIIKKFIDTLGITNYKDNFIFVSDSLVISDSKNKLVAHRFTQKEYPNTPTEDYLFFYLPKQNIIHCACMYNKWEGVPVDGKEILTGREEDLNRFLAGRNLKPEYLIRLTNEKNEPNDMQPLSGLENVISSGIRSSDIMKSLMDIDQMKLNESSDEIVNDLIKKNIPPSIINSAVYSLLRKKDLPKALSFARIQALLNPSDPNSWDTYGEVYYFMGDNLMAAYYEKQSKKVKPDYSSGGIEVWQKDLENHQKIWDENIK
ncbi:MAG: hypothetical protein ABI543_01515 [Ignavibacteria bacterium]